MMRRQAGGGAGVQMVQLYPRHHYSVSAGDAMVRYAYQTQPPAYATNWPVVKRLVPSMKGMQNAANSSNVPRRPIGTMASTRARDSSSTTPLARRNSGKSMKFVPITFTWTPEPTTSAATFGRAWSLRRGRPNRAELLVSGGRRPRWS